MKIKEQIMGNLFGDIDVSIFFKRIQKIYPQGGANVQTTKS